MSFSFSIPPTRPARRREARFRPSLEHASLERRQLLALAPLAAPTDLDQYMLELINRARANPQAEARRLLQVAQTDPTIRAATRGWDLNAFAAEMASLPSLPPLAFNPRLIAAAVAQNATMLARNSQDHSPPGFLTDSSVGRNPDGQPYFPIAPNSYWSTGENIYAYSRNVPAGSSARAYVDYLYAGLMIDWGVPDFGHLKNLMAPGPSQAIAMGQAPFAEVGIGVLTDAQPRSAPPSNPTIKANRGLDVGPTIVSQEFAWNSGRAFLTGTFSTDYDGDGFYSPGEGIGGVIVQATGLDGQGTFRTNTWSTGGYSLALPPGRYDVIAVGSVPTLQETTVTIGVDNVGWSKSFAAGPPADTPVPADYDGDGKTDLAVFRPDTAEWFVVLSSGGTIVRQFGWPGVDQPVPADYDGDGKADLAVFRPLTADWIIDYSSGGSMVKQFGMAGHDVPVPADYDGDGKADLAVFRPVTAEWLILRSTAGPWRKQFGMPMGDVPVPADYDGDGKADPATFRPQTAEWFLLRSQAGPIRYRFGWPGVDQPVPADYDGDGRIDLAVYRPQTSEWFVWQSRDGGRSFTFAPPGGTMPVDGDYDGDGKVDLALFRPADALWLQNRTTQGVRINPFGRPGPGALATTLSRPSLANNTAARRRVAIPAARHASGFDAIRRTPPRFPGEVRSRSLTQGRQDGKVR